MLNVSNMLLFVLKCIKSVILEATLKVMTGGVTMSATTELWNPWNELLCEASQRSGKYLCEPSWSWQPGPFSDYDLWYAVSGQGTMSINGVSYAVQPGSCFVMQPGDQITAEHNPNQPLIVLFCHFSLLDRAGNALNSGVLPSERQVTFRDTSLIEPYMQQLIDEVTQRKANDDIAETDLLLKLILTRWIRELTRRDASDDFYYHKQIISKVKDAIQLHLSEPLDYEALGESVGFTPRYVSRMMKKFTGISLKETVTKLRMERAIHLLTETTMTVTEVSHALGYSDIYTFSKLFKRYYGFSPTKLRRKDKIKEISF